jgi:DNA ligase-1
MNVEKFISLGTDYQPGRDRFEGWTLSEKLEDVRCLFDGERCWTRSGKVIAIPPSIRATLPTGRRLDLGVWAGRGKFYQAREAVIYGRWTKNCRLVAFDALDIPGSWTTRISEAGKIYHDCISYTHFTGWRECNELLESIQRAGGEGLMARPENDGGYPVGRTTKLIKIKQKLL